MNAIYNEIDPFAAQWLDNLVAAGHVASGKVDRRSISDLTPADVAGPGQRHFFAGIGGWSYALRLAGIADDADVWTGSCPCQPFSDAGKGLGILDPRHLWPAWFGLIRECRPPTIFGEQVASRDGLTWLDIVRRDLEGCGYAFGASDLSAAGVGAPHIRQRLYFVAYAREGRRSLIGATRLHDHRQPGHDVVGRGADDWVADAVPTGRTEWRTESGLGSVTRSGGASGMGNPGLDRAGQHTGELPRDEAQHEVGCANGDHAPVDSGAVGGMADAGQVEWRPGCERGSQEEASREWREGPPDHQLGGDIGELDVADSPGPQARDAGDSGASGSHEQASALDPWSDCDWLPCTDGVARPVEPGTFPLATRVPARVGRLRGYGNAIVPQVAAIFIWCAEDARARE